MWLVGFTVLPLGPPIRISKLLALPKHVIADKNGRLVSVVRSSRDYSQ